jgi:hypothetical protein
MVDGELVRWVMGGYVGRGRRFIYPLPRRPHVASGITHSLATTRSCLLLLFGQAQARGVPVPSNAPITPPSPRVILPPRCHPPIVVIAIRVHVHHMT